MVGKGDFGGGMNSVFSEQILADKLSKLNSTQQCIETLSHWCIFHRTKAELVVSTWAKQFHSSEMAQKVPLLYLANDILQNSKRKGNEFVTEFWKVLPAALKDVYEKGDDHGKNVVSRLVGIWGERRVFGQRGQSLKDVMLGEELPPPLELRKKRSRSVKIIKRDSRSIRTKLTIGDTAEKIVSAFHLVLSEHLSEDEQMTKCKSAVHRVKKMEKDIDIALTKVKDPKRITLTKELEEEENILKQCIEKLKVVEANRLALVAQLREGLHEQESELENVRTQMQVAQAQAEEASNMRKQLSDENYVADSKPSNTTPSPVDAKKTAAAIAAEVADKLAASSSSQYIMTSVLSTFAAEEAKKAGLTKPPTAPSVNNSTSKPETPLPVSGPNTGPNLFMPVNVQTTNPYHQSVLGPQISQAQFHTISNLPSQQYNFSTSYGYATIPNLTPGPPRPPSYMMSPMVPLNQQIAQQQQQQQLTLAHQQQPMNLAHQQSVPVNYQPMGSIQPPGMMYYTLPHNSQ